MRILRMILILSASAKLIKRKTKLRRINLGCFPIWGSHDKSTVTPLKFIRPPREVSKYEAPTINQYSTQFTVLMLYFTAVVYLLVEQTYLYYRQYFDKHDEGRASSSPLPDMSLAPTVLELAQVARYMGTGGQPGFNSRQMWCDNIN